MRRDHSLLFGALAVALFCMGGFMFASVRIANEARRITQYNNPNMAENLAAIKRNPGNAAAHNSLAHNYISKGTRYDPQAIAELRTVVRLEPENSEAAFLLAAKLAKQKRYDESIKLYRDIAKRGDEWSAAAARNARKLQARR